MKSVSGYPWEHTNMSLEDLQCLLDKRRDQLLFDFPEYSQNCDDGLISEWMSLLMKRDDITQQMLRQENEKHLFGHLLQLQKLLAVIDSFRSYTPHEMQHSISVLCRQVHKYIDECNQTETSSEKQSDTETVCRFSETESTQNECNIDAKLSDVIPKIVCSETESTQAEHISKAKLLDVIPKSMAKIIPKRDDVSAVLPDVAVLGVDDVSELKDSCLTDVKSSTSNFSAQHLSEHKQAYSSGVFSADSTPVPEAQISNVSVSNAGSLSFMTEKQQVDSELDRSVISELANFLDNGPDAVTDMVPIRSSTPHNVNSLKGDASGTSKAVRRKRSSRNRSRKKSKPSPRTGQGSGNSYRPSLWGIVTNVIGWYNGKPVPSSENKTASLQISID